MISYNKELIEFSFNLAKGIAVLVIGFFSYIKFFKGHLFISKFQLNVNCESFDLEEKFVHFIEILIKNEGPYSEYDPKVKISSFGYNDKNGEKERIEGPHMLWPPETIKDIIKVIRPNETMSFYCNMPCSKVYPFVFFEVEVGIDNGEGLLKKTVARQNKTVTPSSPR